METNSIPTAVSPCQGIYSGIRTDSFDVLAESRYALGSNLDMPINHPILRSDNSNNVDNIKTHEIDSFDSIHTDWVHESNIMCLNADKVGHKYSCSSAIRGGRRFPNSSTVKSLDFHDHQGAGSHKANMYPVQIMEDNTDSYRISASTQQDGTIDCSMTSFDHMNNELDLDNKSDDEICTKNKNDSPLSETPTVKIITTKSETGTLQMFLVEDTDIDFDDEDNSCKSSSRLKTNKNIGYEKLHSRNQDKVKSKDQLPVQMFADKKSLKNEETIDNNYEEANLYDKPSRRSLRLKTSNRSLSSFGYKMYSDEINLDSDENETLTIRDLTIANRKFNGDNESETENNNARITKKRKTSETKLYACDMCQVTCKTESNLNQHKQTHNIREPVICIQCGYSCKKKSDMKKHKETHGPKSLYKCTECDYSGKRLRYLKRHILVHHKDVSYPCHLCDYRSPEKASLDIHLLGHSNLKPCSSVEYEKSFKKNSTFPNHMMAYSNGRLSTCDDQLESYETDLGTEIMQCIDITKTDDLERYEAGQNTEIIQCIDITKRNIGQRRRKINQSGIGIRGDNRDVQTEDTVAGMSIESSKGRLDMCGTYGGMKIGTVVQCAVCNYSCTSKTVLSRHMRRHSDTKPYVCQQCGSSFKRKDHLTVHKFTHSGIRPYKCPHCLYGTHRRYRLKLHILTHQTMKPVKCSLCAYSCRRDCELKYHMKNKHDIEQEIKTESTATLSENGDTVFTCELCGYTCDSQKRLKYHMTRHDNKTPHSCHHCDYKCSSRSSLTDHLLQHAGLKPCLCTICGMAFRNTSRLNRHRLVHSDVKPHGCDYCDFTSRSKYNLKQHVLRHTDQDKARRRNRKSPESKNSTSNNKTAIKQSHLSDLQTYPGGHVDSNLYLGNIKTERDENQIFQDFKTNSNYKEAFQSVPLPQCINRNQINTTHDDYILQSRNIDHTSGSGFNSVYPNASMNINPYHIERAVCTSALNPASSFSDPYQNPNPFSVHTHPMTYNSGPANPSFCYLDRDTGYGFANSCFYNETVFPGSVNASMNVYACAGNGNTCALNPSSTLPSNTNFAHLNPSVGQHIIHPILPQGLATLVPKIENDIQNISETDDSHLENLTTSEDISADASVNHGMTTLKQSKSQAKKTGARLDGGMVSTEDSLGENSAKLTHICSECGYICLTNTMLQRHRATHADLKPHKCDVCGKSFKRSDHMKAHRLTHSKDKPFNCKHCTYTCSRKYRLKLHEMTHANEPKHSCNVCNGTVEEVQGLENRTVAHPDDFMFACNKCEFKCKEKPELGSQHETHKAFMCEECSYVCKSSREFNSHKRMHAEKEELMCTLCSYTCDSQKRLKYHMERHKNKTPHACPHCDYKCSSRSSLTDHLLQHEGLKPFLCSVCGMKFRNVSRLNRHKMTHTDIKPHSCDYCPFSSRSRYNLKQHMLRHFK